MSRLPTSISALCLLTAALVPAAAATRKLRLPDQYDGSWTIVATTAEGPCSASTSYPVHIKDGDASIPEHDVDIDGGVTAGGSVTATITKGSTKLPITGRLDSTGNGSGTWQTLGGLVACTGSWNAKRLG